MEQKLRFPLNMQLFAEKGKGDVIDADEELEKIPLDHISDKDTEDDVDEDDIVDDDEDLEDEDEDEDLADEEDDESEDKSKEDKSKKGDEKEEEKEETSTSKEEGKTEDSTKKNPGQPQSRDVNHEQKLLRERREAEEKARKENFTKGFIAALGGKNPYTGEEIKTDDDIHEAQVMIEAKKRGLDPIQDFHKMDKILRQEEREKAEKEENAKIEAKKQIDSDINEFKEKYPDEDISAFLDTVKEKGFEDLVGKVPLTRIKTIIEGVNKEVANAVEDKKDMSKARRQATPGSVGSGGDSNGDFYTREELAKMSPSEIKANWPKVERSYERLSKSGKGGK